MMLVQHCRLKECPHCSSSRGRPGDDGGAKLDELHDGVAISDVGATLPVEGVSALLQFKRAARR